MMTNAQNTCCAYRILFLFQTKIYIHEIFYFIKQYPNILFKQLPPKHIITGMKDFVCMFMHNIIQVYQLYI